MKTTRRLIRWLPILLIAGLSGCASDNRVNETHYTETPLIWGETSDGLQIGYASLLPQTPLPWLDFTKIYLKNASDKPLRILAPPTVLTNDDVLASGKNPVVGDFSLLTATIHDKQSGATYYVNSVSPAKASEIVLSPGQQISTLIRLNVDIPQQAGQNSYSTVWSFHVAKSHLVGTAGAPPAERWSGDLHAPQCDTTVD